jgi:N-methylhydantoinase B
VKLCLTLTKSGTDLNFDFTGTDERTRGPINLALTTTLSSCYVALKHIFPEVPVNGGAFRRPSSTFRTGACWR